MYLAILNQKRRNIMLNEIQKNNSDSSGKFMAIYDEGIIPNHC